MPDVLHRDDTERLAPGDAAAGHGEHDRLERARRYPASGPHPELAVELKRRGGLVARRTGDTLVHFFDSPAPQLLGRALFGGYFLYNGINHFQNSGMMTGYAEAKGVPAPGLAVSATGAMLVAGGLSLLAGFRPKLGAALTTAFLAGVTPMMHAFWREQDPQQRMAEMVNFTKNIALIGGAMFAASVQEPWRYAPPSR